MKSKNKYQHAFFLSSSSVLTKATQQLQPIWLKHQFCLLNATCDDHEFTSCLSGGCCKHVLLSGEDL